MADGKKTNGVAGGGWSGHARPGDIRLEPSRGHAPYPDAVAVAYDPIPQSLLALAEELEDALRLALAEKPDDGVQPDGRRRKPGRKPH